MTTARQNLVHWLRDAYAMEHQAIEMMERQADRIKNYPELKERISRHVQETKNQAERLEQCLKRLGEDTSVFKTTMGKMVGFAQAMSGLFVSDEIVKGSVAGYVFEHYEIGNYKVLIAAAQKAGEEEIARICGEILKEEEEMARWLEKHLPLVVQQFLGRDEAGQNAKV
ncbi:MAG: ferritin-like domain-containing protein [Pseudomonadota bacterium]|nr:ferritin-like domain-containing protein [Pseudomonadota bacterium]